MKRYFILFLLLAAVSACYYDNTSELYPAAGLNTGCDTVDVTYTKSIAPIFSSSCGTNNSCHSAAIAEGGVILEDYQHAILVDNVSMMEAIEQTGSKPMPPSGKLSDCHINMIELWILNGKPE